MPDEEEASTNTCPGTSSAAASTTCGVSCASCGTCASAAAGFPPASGRSTSACWAASDCFATAPGYFTSTRAAPGRSAATCAAPGPHAAAPLRPGTAACAAYAACTCCGGPAGAHASLPSWKAFLSACKWNHRGTSNRYEVGRVAHYTGCRCGHADSWCVWAFHGLIASADNASAVLF